MQAYSQLIGQKEISTASVQTAIQSLRERGLLWQSGRGTYALEDESFAEWFNHMHQ
jgi:DNA-binding IclR family transcriptional regulator